VFQLEILRLSQTLSFAPRHYLAGCDEWRAVCAQLPASLAQAASNMV
jgi:hypothetical protein